MQRAEGQLSPQDKLWALQATDQEQNDSSSRAVAPVLIPQLGGAAQALPPEDRALLVPPVPGCRRSRGAAAASSATCAGTAALLGASGRVWAPAPFGACQDVLWQTGRVTLGRMWNESWPRAAPLHPWGTGPAGLSPGHSPGHRGDVTWTQPRAPRGCHPGTAPGTAGLSPGHSPGARQGRHPATAEV